MPVTEVALLHLNEGKEWTSPEVLDGLRMFKNVLEKATGSPFHFLRGVEHPRTGYMHGSWATIQDHVDFARSEENKKWQAVVQPLVTPQWAFHLNIDQAKTPLPTQAPLIALGRYFVKEGKIDEVEAAFDKNIATLEAGVGGPQNITRGRRLDKGWDPSTAGELQPEYVLLTGWQSVQQHEEFAKTLAGSDVFTHLQTLVTGGEFLHTTLLL